jgi:hypothetical protein
MGYKIEAMVRSQPSAADQVAGFHSGSATHRAHNSPSCAKTHFTAQKRRDQSSGAQKHVRQPLLCFDAPIGGALPLDIPLREPLDCYDEDLVRRELEGLWGAARGVCGTGEGSQMLFLC